MGGALELSGWCSSCTFAEIAATSPGAKKGELDQVAQVVVTPAPTAARRIERSTSRAPLHVCKVIPLPNPRARGAGPARHRFAETKEHAMSLNAEQLALRRTRIGSSEIGALLGIDPYKNAFDVFIEKTLPQADAGADHQTWGLDLEPSILAFHARKRGYTLMQPPDKADRWPSFTHPTLPLVCTPDALAVAPDGNIALQAKNDQGYGQTDWGDPNTDDAPMLYLAQTTIEMGVRGEVRARPPRRPASRRTATPAGGGRVHPPPVREERRHAARADADARAVVRDGRARARR
jgi:hypothetical protein